MLEKALDLSRFELILSELSFDPEQFLAVSFENKAIARSSKTKLFIWLR
jgi:hypothetical protein